MIRPTSGRDLNEFHFIGYPKKTGDTEEKKEFDSNMQERKTQRTIVGAMIADFQKKKEHLRKLEAKITENEKKLTFSENLIKFKEKLTKEKAEEIIHLFITIK